LSQVPDFAERVPVPPAKIRIKSVGVNALDRRRVDVAVDLTPCQEPLNIEMVIVGPDDDELSSILLVDSREWMLDKVIHLRQDAQQGEHVLHVGVFYENELMAQAARRFTFPLTGSR
jgi:hypothetical protein